MPHFQRAGSNASSRAHHGIRPLLTSTCLAPYHYLSRRITDGWYALIRQTVQAQTDTLSLFIADDRWIPRTAATHRPLWYEWAHRVHFEADAFFQMARFQEVVVDLWWDHIQPSVDSAHITTYFYSR